MTDKIQPVAASCVQLKVMAVDAGVPGSSQQMKAARVLGVSAAGMQISGQPQLVHRNKLLTVTPGTYTVTPSNLQYSRAKTVSISVQAMAVNTNGAQISRHRMAMVTARALSFTGNTVQARRALVLSASASYQVAMQYVAVSRTLTDRVLTPFPGSYVVSEGSARMLLDRIYTVEGTAYEVTNQPQGMRMQRAVSIAATPFTVTPSLSTLNIAMGVVTSFITEHSHIYSTLSGSSPFALLITRKSLIDA